MRKLRMQIDDLRVETFSTEGANGRERGTVRGQAEATYACSAGWQTCAQDTIQQATCNPSDVGTDCGFSCVYLSCDPMTCADAGSCESGPVCHSFRPCTAPDCVF